MANHGRKRWAHRGESEIPTYIHRVEKSHLCICLGYPILIHAPKWTRLVGTCWNEAQAFHGISPLVLRQHSVRESMNHDHQWSQHCSKSPHFAKILDLPLRIPLKSRLGSWVAPTPGACAGSRGATCGSFDRNMSESYQQRYGEKKDLTDVRIDLVYASICHH